MARPDSWTTTGRRHRGGAARGSRESESGYGHQAASLYNDARFMICGLWFFSCKKSEIDLQKLAEVVVCRAASSEPAHLGQVKLHSFIISAAPCS